MKNLFIVIIILIVCLTLTACTNQEIGLTDFNNGEYLASQFDYSQALISYKNSINKNTHHTESYLKASDILILKKQYSEASELLEKGKNLVEKKDELLSKLGESYFLQFKFEEARDSFRLAVENNETNSQAALGYIHSMSLIADPAINEFILERLNINDNELTEVAKIFYLMNDQLDKALEILEMKKSTLTSERYELILQTINNFRDKPLVERNMEFARVMINEGLPGLSLSLINKVIETNEFYDGGYLFKSIIKYLTGDNETALELINKAITINSNNSLAFRYKGLILSKSGEIPDASDAFDIAVGLATEQNRLEILKDAFTFQKSNKLFTNAEITSSEIVKIENSEENQYELGQIYCMGDFSLQTLEGFINNFKPQENFKSKLSQACSYIKEGNYNEANKIIVQVQETKSRELFLLYLDYKNKLKTGDIEASEITKNMIFNFDIEGSFIKLIED